MPRLNLLLAAPTLGVYGGIEAVMLALGRSLAQSADFSPRLVFKLAAGGEPQPALRERCAESGLPIEFVRPASRELWRAIGWADLVHGHNLSPDIGLFAALRGKPLVATVHHRRPARWSPRAQLWRWALHQPCAIWFNSRSVADTWGGLSRPNRAVIYQVCELHPEFAPLAPRRGFAFVSRWIPHKGIEVLIAAYAGARLDKTLHPLHLMGTGPLLPIWRERLAAAPVAGLTIHGFVTEAEKRRRIGAARWLVVPPHTNEDMGLTPIEGRSLGVPCVVTRDGGLPEVSGTDAIVCEPGSVEALSAALEQAAALPDQEYVRRAESTFRELAGQIVPLATYAERYRAILAQA